MTEGVVAQLLQTIKRHAGESSDFDLNPSIKLTQGRVLRPAAVLLVVWIGPHGARLLLTKRASHLKQHAGQIAFPGGKVDDIDASPEAAALREAWEEIGLPEARVDLLGSLPPHETVTGFSVTPVVGILRGGFEPVAEASEVQEVFTVPLAHTLSLTNFAVERRRWKGEWRNFYALPYGPYYIWGATARILRGLAGPTHDD